MKHKRFAPNSLGFMIGVNTIILFFCSSLKHTLFQSTAWDLGFFNQVIYLISQGETPVSSFSGFHILGDHAAFIVYPLALLYKIYPDVHWLLALQALVLSLGALPTFYLARQAGLKKAQCQTLVLVYLLYPLIFNISLFDFHPDIIALPAILGAILAARLGFIGWFSLAILLTLSCKAVFSLTVAAMGFWLLLCEKKRGCGALALASGIAWFLVTTQLIIPHFNGGKITAVERYLFLGDSVAEIAKNILLQPNLVLEQFLTLGNLQYLLMLLFPIIWGFYPQHFSPLIGAIPMLGLNLLTDSESQKNLAHQYSLPIFPFLLLVVISTLGAGQGWIRSQRGIMLWILVHFLVLTKFGHFGSYFQSIDTWQGTRAAIAHIETQGSVLTSSQISPHLTHRQVVKLATVDSDFDLHQFEYVLLDQRHPGWRSSPEFIASLVSNLKQKSAFQLIFEQDDVVLFKQVP